MNIRFHLSANPANLKAFLDQHARTATVEAEYGDTLVSGTVFTMAHHGLRAGQPAPCSYPNGCAGTDVEVVGLSHVDLDSLGGCLAILGVKPEATGFWQLAEFVDINGPHKLSESGASDEDIRRLHAFWAWSEKNKMFPPRDGSVLDVTDYVNHSITVIQSILSDEAGYLEDGDAFKAAGEKLNAESFVESNGDVILRVAPSFVNHLYVSPEGKIAKAVVAFNTKTGSITVSFANAPQGKSAKDIVQEILGSEAGGHAGIAGSPRNVRCGFDDLKKVYDLTLKSA